MGSFAEIFAAAEKRYGKPNIKVREIFAKALMDSLSNLFSGMDFDFIHVLPHTAIADYVAANKPVTSFATVFPKEFFAPGWFYTVDGQAGYSVGAPLNPTSDNFTTGATWINHVVEHVNFIYLYDNSGVFQREIAVLAPDRVMTGLTDDITQTGMPEAAYVHNDDYGTTFRLLPTPDDEWLCSASYKVGRYPVPTTGEGSNPYIENFPEICVQLGVRIYAEFYNDFDRVQLVNYSLFGNPQNPHDEGLLAQVRRAERRRNNPSPSSIGFFPSQALAIGRMTSNRHYTSGGGYYTTR